MIFHQKLFEKADFICQLTGPAMESALKVAFE